MPGNVLAEPSQRPVDACLYLTSFYKTHDGKNVDVRYTFWMANRCERTRKRLVNGFKFMCERPLENKETGVGNITFFILSQSSDI